MKREGILKHIALAFGVAIVLYAIGYAGIEHRRTRQGPWQVTFTNDPAGAPAIVINHPRLAITNVQITFPGATLAATNAPLTQVFDQARQVPYPVAFGLCRFQDTTFLPGTVVLELFGHEIQLVPRVLSVDRQERPWRSGEVIVLR